MIIRKVTLDDKSDLEFIEKLYIESFPRYERRPILQMHQLLEKEERFNMYLLETEDNIRIGFATYWILDTFIFLDHFAISSEQRNGGHGQNAIEVFTSQINLPLIGEIELPGASDMAARRLKFYEKHGFKIWDLPYEQPPYEDGYDPIPMLIITHGDFGFPANFETIRDKIYSEVYKKKI